METIWHNFLSSNIFQKERKGKDLRCLLAVLPSILFFASFCFNLNFFFFGINAVFLHKSSNPLQTKRPCAIDPSLKLFYSWPQWNAHTWQEHRNTFNLGPDVQVYSIYTLCDLHTKRIYVSQLSSTACLCICPVPTSMFSLCLQYIWMGKLLNGTAI